MIYVYSRYIDGGKDAIVGIYEKWEDAIEKITSLYNMDAKSAMKGQFYYFAKELVQMSNATLARYLRDYGKSRAGEIRSLTLAAADRICELSARIKELEEVRNG